MGQRTAVRRLMRTLAIGLDGCSWNVLEPLLESGELPHLSALHENGRARRAREHRPVLHGPGLGVVRHGASPAAHGIYDFMMLRPDGTLSVAHQGDLRRKTYFQQLGQEGRRSVLVNLPLDQDGCENTVIVNSWLTDDAERRILPVGRSERYERLLKAYRTFPENQEDLDELCAIEQARFDLARELFLAEGWEHFFILFSSTDWFGHVATGAFLAGDPDARAAMLRLYKQIDGHIGWFVERAPDALTTVVSDHGQCEEEAVVRVNAVLHELGLIAMRDRARRAARARSSRPAAEGRARVRVPAFLGRFRSNRCRPARWHSLPSARSGAGSAWSSPGPHARSTARASRAFWPTDASFAVYLRTATMLSPSGFAEALLAVRLKDGRRARRSGRRRSCTGGGRSRLADVLFSPALGVRPSAIDQGAGGSRRQPKDAAATSATESSSLGGPKSRRATSAGLDLRTCARRCSGQWAPVYPPAATGGSSSRRSTSVRGGREIRRGRTCCCGGATPGTATTRTRSPAG